MTASRPGVDVEKMRSMRWFHKIDLGPGVVTPGYDWEDLWSPTSRFLDGVDFRGKRVMEIGCWDGMWSFDAERRGAA
jgi:tRNA (mo5U34)-methyltransferase